MNLPAWKFDRCPKCNAENSVELDADTRLCLECRHEWAPSVTVGPLVDTPTDAGVSSPPALQAVPDPRPLDSFDAYLAEARSRLLGAKATYHDAGVDGTITEVTDDGYAILTFGSGYYVELLPNEFTVVAADVIPDDTITALATTDMNIAAQCLRAAVATLESVGTERRLSMPPEGWLPDDAGAMPVIEHGAAYAIAYLALQYGVATDDLTSMADMLDNAATAAEGANTNGQNEGN